uniref:EamA domain-containing protein n=1 Tax=Globisporangium ultimum (strain ATCC 200006 / CBS 805.95 / DAOM BR144) TaxID=431595 RepID=K3WQD4_GLOUD
MAKQLRANNCETTPSTTDPHWWCYPLIAFFDVQANCVAVRSLAFADYVSVGLMMNLTIPFVSFLSYIMHYRTYSRRHVAGCCIATIGGGTLFLGSYYRDEMDTTGSQQTYGCFLAMLAAFMYGACNVTNQLFLKVHTVDQIIESVGLIGSWGSVFAMIQMLLFERAQVTAIAWSDNVGLYFTGYIVAMFTFYFVVSLLPQASSSAIYNLSILMSNLYLVFASSALFGETAHNYFCIALVLVLAGLTMHCLEHSKEAQAASTDPSKPHPSFNSMQTPSDLKLIKIQIEQAAL